MGPERPLLPQNWQTSPHKSVGHLAPKASGPPGLLATDACAPRQDYLRTTAVPGNAGALTKRIRRDGWVKHLEKKSIFEISAHLQYSARKEGSKPRPHRFDCEDPLLDETGKLRFKGRADGESARDCLPRSLTRPCLGHPCAIGAGGAMEEVATPPIWDRRNGQVLAGTLIILFRT